MLDWTDRHCRYFLRLISPSVQLYTEMITTSALLHGDQKKLLAYNEEEHPLVLQLGGSDPQELAMCARLAESAGYDEVNLNVGCPSDRVQSGRFGACLMAEPRLVADAVRAIRQAVAIPVTVKTRTGIDKQDSYAFLFDFVSRLVDAGVDKLIVHARKAWLKGLSPKQNREIPPLEYDRVYQLKQDFPELKIHINGGICSVEEIHRHLQQVDGVMIGREAYHRPWILAEIEAAGGADLPDRETIIQRLLPYIESQLSQGARLNHITRHILGLFHGCPGGRGWRRLLSERSPREGAGIEVIQAALEEVS